MTTSPLPASPLLRTTAGPCAVGGDEVGADEAARARVVGRAVAAAAARTGVEVDGLMIWGLGGGRPVDALDGPDAAPDSRPAHGDPGRRDDTDGGAVRVDEAVDRLAGVLETATDDGLRRARGLHVTPPWLAEELAGRALAGVATGPVASPPTVCDPACGGGAFLVAAARRLHRAGLDRRRVVRDLLWGADIDPVGLAAAEAALCLWAGERPPPGRLVVGDPLDSGVGLWPDPPADGFGAVVGNPPFQSQLGRATARSAAAQGRLRARFGDAVRAYTDTAWLFLLLGCDLVRPGGRVVLVEPQSVVAARDAEAVRVAIDRRATLVDLWVDDGRVFDASVRVCAPVLERRPDTAEAAQPGAGAWGRMWGDALGLPDVHIGSGATLGERADIIAGFRDQYYGLVDVVREIDASEPRSGVAPLVTSGLVDWAACAWGERPVRYAKRRWQAPVVDLARLAAVAPPIARRWVARTRAPKLVVATQTRVVEAAVDPAGSWVPSVPTIAVVPTDPEDLWRLAAAVLSPAATAWLARRSGGTGLDRGVLKVAGPDLVALPLPANGPAWDAAADALRTFVAGPTPAALAGYLAAAGRAYPGTADLDAWWRRKAGSAVRTDPADG